MSDYYFSEYYCRGLRELTAKISRWREDKGFETNWDNIPEKLLLIHSEVSEACEEHRKATGSGDDAGFFDEFEYELADIAIRLFDLAGSLKIPLELRIAEKMEKNEGREHKHGKGY